MGSDEWMTPRECYEFLKVSEHVIYDAIRDGRLVAYRFGPNKLRVRQSDFLKFIEASKTA